MTLKMKGTTDVTAGRAMAARRGVGRVHHLDARFSWLQQLWAEGMVRWCLRLSRPGEHNEADLESKMIESTLLVKGTPLRPPMSSMSRSSRMVAASFTAIEAARDCRVSIWNVRNVCETNGWLWICVGLVIAILMVLSGGPSGISTSDAAEGDRRECCAATSNETSTISKIRTTAWNPDGSGVTCRSERPADADGTGAICRHETCRRWWNWCGLRAQELQVLLVRRQRSQILSV